MRCRLSTLQHLPLPTFHFPFKGFLLDALRLSTLTNLLWLPAIIFEWQRSHPTIRRTFVLPSRKSSCKWEVVSGEW